MDIDMLVLDPEFKSIFKIKENGFYKTVAGVLKETADFNVKLFNKCKSYEDFLATCKINNITTMFDGSLVLLTPNKEVHDGYKKMVDEIKELEWLNWNLFDEVSIIYYLTIVLKQKYELIPTEYGGAWRNVGLKLLCKNFRCDIKPWKRPSNYKWEGEFIWEELFNEIINPTWDSIQKQDYYTFYKNIKKYKPSNYNGTAEPLAIKFVAIILPNKSRGLLNDATIISNLLSPMCNVSINYEPINADVVIYIEKLGYNDKGEVLGDKVLYFPNYEFITDWDEKAMSNKVIVCCKNQMTYDLIKSHNKVLTKFTTVDKHKLSNGFSDLKLYDDTGYFVSICGDHNYKNYKAVLESWKNNKTSNWLIVSRISSEFNKQDDNLFKSLYGDSSTIKSLRFMGMPNIIVEGFKNNKHKIIQIGYIDDDIKFKLIYNSKALILPSLCEGFGITLNEALMLDKPIITTNYNPMSDFSTNLIDCTLTYGKTKANSNKIKFAYVKTELLSEAYSDVKPGYGRKKYLEDYQWFKSSIINLVL